MQPEGKEHATKKVVQMEIAIQTHGLIPKMKYVLLGKDVKEEIVLQLAFHKLALLLASNAAVSQMAVEVL